MLDACRDNGIVAGIHTGSGEVARTRAEQGFRLIAIGSDADFLADSAAAAMAAARPAGRVGDADRNGRHRAGGRLERAVTNAQTTPDFRTEAFIDGVFVGSATGARTETVNPARGTTLADVAACDGVDVDVAVAAARRAFESGVWSRLPPSERKEVLQRFASVDRREH